MKKWPIVLSAIALCGISACSGGGNNESAADYKDYSINEVSDGSEFSETGVGDEEGTEVDTINRTIIAEALGVEENNRNIRFILSSLDTIGAGQIQSAEAAEEDGERVINLVAEDGVNYRLYLSGSGNVEAVKNMDTGEWPIQSKK